VLHRDVSIISLAQYVAPPASLIPNFVLIKPAAKKYYNNEIKMGDVYEIMYTSPQSKV
jgi:hypothetical protein